MLISRILNTLRTIFLVIAVGAVATIVFWPSVRTRLGQLDEGLLGWHVEGPRKRLVAARQALGRGEHETARAALASLAADLEDVRFGDRRAWIRMTALEVLARHLDDAGDEAAALECVDRILEHDPRSFPAMLHRADLLDQLGREDEAFAYLESVWAVGSRSGKAQLAYLSGLAERGRDVDVAKALIDLGPFSPLVVATTGWELRTSDDESFTGAERVSVDLERDDASGRLHGTMTFGEPRTVQMLRVDLPTLCLLDMSDFRCVLVLQDGSEVLLGTERITSKRHLVRPEGADDDRVLIAVGENDPYFVMEVARAGDGAGEPQLVEGAVALRFEGRLGARLPAAIAAAARGGLEARAELVERYGERRVRTVEEQLDG